MNSYIYRVAKQFYNHFDEEITKFSFVFPNRRAGIFFQKYISDMANKPLFSPEILTIDECFMAATTLKPADKTEMLFILFDIYRRISGSNDSFDTFIYWGEVLLSDFNEADKYLINTRQMFNNLSEWKEIDYSHEYFSENQINTIRQFWGSFNINQSENRESFLQIWQVLFNLYHEFRYELSNKGQAYEGMIFRNVIENLTINESVDWFKKRKFVFIGFNALNPCEKQLMKYLNDLQIADFYWDYEAEILQDPENPASEFYRINTTMFPSKMLIEPGSEPITSKKFHHITVSSAIGQARYMYHILNNTPVAKEDAHRLISTAIILPDENLLVPVLQSIPEKIDIVNVTMGFPLEMTPVAGLIQLIFNLRKKVRLQDNQILFHHRSVIIILNHPLIVLLSENQHAVLLDLINKENLIYSSPEFYSKDRLLSLIFRDTNADSFIGYLIDVLAEIDLRLKSHREQFSGFELDGSFIYQYFITVKRFEELLLKYKNRVSINIDTLINIITGLCSGISVPFVGEPLNGLQIMGVLEARGLDFENIIIPSFNEGIFPGNKFNMSYIPYHLRKGFGLPTYELNDSVVSYNFYRLLNRAKNIYFISDNRSETGNSSEVSRFLYQLKYQYKVEIKEINPYYEISATKSPELKVYKDELIRQKLMAFSEKHPDKKAFSASSLNTYMNCPLNFYLKYVEDYNKEDEISELIESDDFGNIFHQTMANLYEIFIEKTVEVSDIEKLINNKEKIGLQIVKAFNTCYYKNPVKYVTTLEGNHLLIASIVNKYVIQVLEYDKKIAPFHFISGEMNVKGYINTRYGKMNLKGYIDRVDEIGGVIRIIDYKTGSGELTFKGIDQLFEIDVDYSKKSTYIFQTFLYAMLYQRWKSCKKDIQPGIFFLRKIFHDDFDWKLKDISDESDSDYIIDFSFYQKQFEEKLIKLIEDILNPEIPFYQTSQLKNCEYCDFKILCNR